MTTCKQSPIPKATHSGVLRIGGAELTCHVLEGETRIIAQREMLSVLGLSRGGAGTGKGDRLAGFVAGDRIKPYVSETLAKGIHKAIRFRVDGKAGRASFAYEATVLVELCTAIVNAHMEGRLQRQQEHIARQAGGLLGAFAKTGIIALVDEATGYQSTRAPGALQVLVDRFIREEPSTWEKRFSSDFYMPLYDLCGLAPRGGNHPRLFAALTRFLVYRRLLPPGALELLDERNPADPNGVRRQRHHQFLTEAIGVPALRAHLAELRGFMRLARTIEELIWYVDRAYPLIGKSGELPFLTPPISKATPRQRSVAAEVL